MSTPVDLRNPGRTIHVGVVLLDSTTELIDVAPVDAFNGLRPDIINSMPPMVLPDELKKQARDFEIHWVTETGKKPAKLTANLSINPTDSFATCPTLDIILMGAAMMGADMMGARANEAELAFLRKCEPTAAAFISICGGFEPFMSAGLLEGKTATAPRPLLPMVRQAAPGTNWIDKRWARDGKMWTSGALLNGFDLVRAFMEEYWGGEGTLVRFLTTFGAYPNKDIDYKDDP